MGIITDKFSNGRMVLIVSLPGNSPDLALAAQAGGADMIKVHLNVTHAASGIHFGSLAEEKQSIEKIVSAVDIPVGIMPGAATTAPFEDMLELESMGISFFDIYLADMPRKYLELQRMEPMIALAHKFRPEDIDTIISMGVNMLEASIVEHGLYGTPLDPDDLQSYEEISSRFDGQVIVPTQKKIKAREVAALRHAGVSGIMIGKIVTGDSPAKLEKATAEFAEAASENS